MGVHPIKVHVHIKEKSDQKEKTYTERGKTFKKFHQRINTHNIESS
jgi:hypothetical protein